MVNNTGLKWIRGTMKRIPITAIALLLITGCSVNDRFIYKTSEPVAGVRKLPVKVAVISFQDGTEDFTTRGTIFNGMTHNLAKGGISIQVTALTPELWAKAFADDLAGSGAFQTVRFVYCPSELTDEEFYIEGTIRKAYYFTDGSKPNEFAIGLRTVRRTDNKIVWEKEVTKSWNLPNGIFEGCGLGQQCKNNRLHAEINKVMQGTFAEAREGLVRALTPLPKSQARKGGLPPAESRTSPPVGQESVEGTIDRILKGQ